jgi:hypothetical protein
VIWRAVSTSLGGRARGHARGSSFLPVVRGFCGVPRAMPEVRDEARTECVDSPALRCSMPGLRVGRRDGLLATRVFQSRIEA